MKEYHSSNPDRILSLGNGKKRVYYNTVQISHDNEISYESDYVDVDGEATYDSVTSALIRQRYSADQSEAILSNYADTLAGISTDTDVRLQEFSEFSAYRSECKRIAKEVLC